ncbi:MAG: exo-alpha-sialidase, partial [Armatimonadetes bacterium]|nr:exo-alpha-sialidase [Armatimonadota bacterium]
STWHTPSPLPLQEFRANPLGVVVSETDPTIFHDKEFMNADANPASPKAGNVYVSWTRFRFACGAGGTGYCESPIFFGQSTDGGATWSAPIEISGSSLELCIFGNFFDPALPASKCNFDQGSWPEVAPNGDVYVSYNNCNTPTLVCQHLFVKCPAGADCSLPASWTPPQRIALDFDTQPFFLGPGPARVPDGCPFGRQCLAPNGYRMNDFGVLEIDPTSGRLYFSWSDFRNGGPCAVHPVFGLPVEPCANHNNDVFLVTSDDGGNTWSFPKKIGDELGKKAAQWQSWMAVGPTGKVYIAYYDRQYGDCDTTGCNDITLAISTDKAKVFNYIRITTSSMPNLTLLNNPIQAGFLGDYLSLAADRRGVVIVWADTRPRTGTVPEEDIYFARVNK